MRRKRLVTAMLAGVLAAGCSTPYGNDAERLADVLEVATRWAFENTETDLDPPAAYCLALPEEGAAQTDPSGTFLDRFSDVEVPVRPVSQCEILTPDTNFEEQRRHAIVDRASGEYGLLIAVGPVRWGSPTAADVHILSLQGGLWGREWQCEIRWSQTEAWQVVTCPAVADI